MGFVLIELRCLRLRTVLGVPLFVLWCRNSYGVSSTNKKATSVKLVLLKAINVHQVGVFVVTPARGWCPRVWRTTRRGLAHKVIIEVLQTSFVTITHLRKWPRKWPPKAGCQRFHVEIPFMRCLFDLTPIVQPRSATLHLSWTLRICTAVLLLLLQSLPPSLQRSYLCLWNARF